MITDRRYSMARQKKAFTLVELLVVIAIIGILVALLLPAIQMARESARKMQCSNNLKQIGVAVSTHVSSQGHYPTGGWGYMWLGDPDRGYAKQQPGGVFYNILPGLEQLALHDMGKNMSDAAKKRYANILSRSPLLAYNCPSRRPSILYKLNSSSGLLVAYNADPNTPDDHFSARSDYAACAGSAVGNFNQGPPNEDAAANFNWGGGFNGVCYLRSMVKNKDIQRGSTHTMFAGEKNLEPDAYYTSTFMGDDQSVYNGMTYDNNRYTANAPRRDQKGVTDISLFGSAHASTCNFLFCDGSNHSIAYDVDVTAFRICGAVFLRDSSGRPITSSQPIFRD